MIRSGEGRHLQSPTHCTSSSLRASGAPLKRALRHRQILKHPGPPGLLVLTSQRKALTPLAVLGPREALNPHRCQVIQWSMNAVEPLRPMGCLGEVWVEAARGPTQTPHHCRPRVLTLLVEVLQVGGSVASSASSWTGTAWRAPPPRSPTQSLWNASAASCRPLPQCRGGLNLSTEGALGSLCPPSPQSR